MKRTLRWIGLAVCAPWVGLLALAVAFPPWTAFYYHGQHLVRREQLALQGILTPPARQGASVYVDFDRLWLHLGVITLGAAGVFTALALFALALQSRAAPRAAPTEHSATLASRPAKIALLAGGAFLALSPPLFAPPENNTVVALLSTAGILAFIVGLSLRGPKIRFISWIKLPLGIAVLALGLQAGSAGEGAALLGFAGAVLCVFALIDIGADRLGVCSLGWRWTFRIAGILALFALGLRQQTPHNGPADEPPGIVSQYLPAAGN